MSSSSRGLAPQPSRHNQSCRLPHLWPLTTTTKLHHSPGPLLFMLPTLCTETPSSWPCRPLTHCPPLCRTTINVFAKPILLLRLLMAMVVRVHCSSFGSVKCGLLQSKGSKGGATIESPFSTLVRISPET